MILTAILIGSLAFVFGMFIIIKWGKLPPWTHRDMLAFLALVATIGGAVILTLLNYFQNETFVRQADRLITELVRDRTVRDEVGQVLTTIIDSQSWITKLQSAGIVIVLLSLGLVISARTIKGKFLGNEFEMDNVNKSPIAVEVKNTPDKPVPTTDEAPQAAAPKTEGDLGP
jgi:hypothetical protein